jgi:hypothetical protein
MKEDKKSKLIKEAYGLAPQTSPVATSARPE